MIYLPLCWHGKEKVNPRGRTSSSISRSCTKFDKHSAIWSKSCIPGPKNNVKNKFEDSFSTVFNFQIIYTPALNLSLLPVIMFWGIAYILLSIRNSFSSVSSRAKTLKLVPPRSRAKNLPRSWPVGSFRTYVGQHLTLAASCVSFLRPS